MVDNWKKFVFIGTGFACGLVFAYSTKQKEITDLEMELACKKAELELFHGKDPDDVTRDHNRNIRNIASRFLFDKDLYRFLMYRL